MFTAHSSLRNWVTSCSESPPPQGKSESQRVSNVAMHFKKNQLLGSGKKILLDFSEANTPQQVGDSEERGPAGRAAPSCRPLAPASVARGRGPSSRGSRGGGPGPRAPSRMGQDMTARFVHQHP